MTLSLKLDYSWHKMVILVLKFLFFRSFILYWDSEEFNKALFAPDNALNAVKSGKILLGKLDLIKGVNLILTPKHLE